MRIDTTLPALVLLGVAAAAADAQTVRDFEGTYDLVRTERLSDTGEWLPTDEIFGANPTGVIMYDGEGSMGVHIVRDTGDASPAPANRYYAYFGHYVVDAERGIVTHRLQNHTNPQQRNSDFVRGFELDGDYLTLTVEPQRRSRLVWRKRR